MNIKQKLYIFAASLLMAACTSESVIEEPTVPDTPGQDDGNRREVLLTLKNHLATKPQQRAARAEGDPIATEDENYIQSLDVYVFGSKEENGVYTFQELHYFRDDASEVTMPGVNAYSFNLNAGTEENTTTGLLKLNKGLFVKLYCIANRTHLYQTDGGGVMTEFTDFKSLEQSAPGQPTNVVTNGAPNETTFKTFHTSLIDPTTTSATADDILNSPLPMTGAYVTPLDLTDFSSSARTQISFKLSRMVARFDIVNDAAASKFTIEKISMGNGQSAAQFFPIQTLVTDPAKLITYPERTIPLATQATPDQATGATSLTTGAFYTWPSPKDDKGYLMLKGKYAVNKTEQKEVSYQIPFQQIVNGVGSYIEVAYNHRYTIAITKADDYHLDFTLNVAEWDEGGEVDEYEPENSFDRNTLLTLETGASTSEAYVLDNGQVELLAAAGSKFAFKMGSNTPLEEELVFKAGSEKWIKKGTDSKGQPRAITSMDSTYTYVIDDTKLADRSKLLPVTIRLTNPASGMRKEIKVIPAPGPTVTFPEVADNYTTFDPTTMTATLYNLAGQTAKFHVAASSRSDRAETPTITTGSSIDIDGTPAWLTADQASVTTEEGDYILTMGTPQDLTSPVSVKVDFTSTATKEKTQITVKLKDTKIATLKQDDFTMGSGSGNTVNMAGGTGGTTPLVTLVGIVNNEFTLSVSSPEGVTAAATVGDTWLDVKASPGTDLVNGMKTTVITGKIKDATDMATTEKTDGEITITNKLNPTETLKVEVATSKPDGPVLTMTAIDGNLSSYDVNTKTATLYNAPGQVITLEALATCTASTTDAWLTVSNTEGTTQTITVATAQSLPLASKGKVTFVDKATKGITEVIVDLADPAIPALVADNFASTEGTNTFTTATASDNAKVTMTEVGATSAFTLTVKSPGGISVDSTNSSDWLVVTRTAEVDNGASGKTATVTIAIADGADLNTAKSDGKIVLTNGITGGGDLTIDVVTTVATAPAP